MATEKKTEVEKKLSHVHHDDQHEVSVEQKLVALYTLQQIDSQIDRIRIIRGELPLEVQDLEDEIAGLETRIEKFENEVIVLNNSVNEKKQGIKLVSVFLGLCSLLIVIANAADHSQHMNS
jgi:chromosome segregation ATPase